MPLQLEQLQRREAVKSELGIDHGGNNQLLQQRQAADDFSVYSNWELKRDERLQGRQVQELRRPSEMEVL